MKIKFILYLFFLFTVFTLSSQISDFSILKKINQKDMPAWDKTMRLTSATVYPAALGCPAGLLLTGYIHHDKPMMRNGVKNIIALTLNQAITSSLKYSIKRQRPYEQYPNDITNRTSVHGFSFPSGHTSTAFATATALTLSTKKWYVSVPAYLYACGVGYSRMRLGVHFPTDVLGGMIVGIGSSLLVWQIDKWMSKP